MSKKEFSESLRREMKRVRLNKRQLAVKTGLSYPTIHAACKGEGDIEPGPGTRTLIALALGLPQNYFESFFEKSSKNT